MSKGKKIKKVFSRIIDVILGAIFILLMAFTTITIVQKYTNSSIVGYRILWVVTESMEDTIPAESYILVKDATAEDIKEQDIAIFVSLDPKVPEGATVTHRIIKDNGNGTFTSKGDHNPFEDEYKVPYDNIRAKHVRNLPVLSIFGKLYTSPAGYGVTMGVIVIMFAVIIAMEKRNSKDLSDKDMDKLVAEEVKRLEEEAKKNKIC